MNIGTSCGLAAWQDNSVAGRVIFRSLSVDVNNLLQRARDEARIIKMTFRLTSRYHSLYIQHNTEISQHHYLLTSTIAKSTRRSTNNKDDHNTEISQHHYLLTSTIGQSTTYKEDEDPSRPYTEGWLFNIFPITCDWSLHTVGWFCLSTHKLPVLCAVFLPSPHVVVTLLQSSLWFVTAFQRPRDQEDDFHTGLIP
ncbi:hypothetical protein J6590_042106 [Homalodisca vitripennis]|nr:hypothetical protein J6590_042106 [Homalodisca vitripennis]